MRLLNHLGWYTFAQAERALGCSHGHLHRLVVTGVAPVKRMGAQWIMRRADLHALLCAKWGLDRSGDLV
jgi:hypothetical protein